MTAATKKIFVVEHLDPELEQWSALEYKTIAEESSASGARFILASVPNSLRLPESLESVQGLELETSSVEAIFAEQKSRVCLLDPAAEQELSPRDGDHFDIFLFGGILGMASSESYVYTLVEGR